jgi:hypothetical protein
MVDSMGLTRCREGYRYRAEAQTCDHRADEGSGDGGASGVGGASSTDCGKCDGEHEFCRASSGPPETAICTRGCLSDDECAENAFCLCNGTQGGFCVHAACRGDADCADGYHCAELESPCAEDVGAFACQSPEDECLTSEDCNGGTCMDSFEGPRRCDDAVCGRPFLVEDEARVATVVHRNDWTELGVAPRVSHLTSAERAAQAAHWEKLGQMEHASIAAFARFQLQLLALGAPAELVRACNQALVDETAHTQLCFALASAYAGERRGPGPLDVAHSLDVTSLADIVELVIAEGCIGETSAALDALEAAEAETDPVLRSAYARIAADEQRHAELAFRFVRWALEQEPGSTRERIASALASAPHSVSLCEVVSPTLLALLEPRVAA